MARWMCGLAAMMVGLWGTAAAAEPGRLTGGADAGVDSTGAPVVHGSIDYGATRRLSVLIEGAARADQLRFSGGMGVQYELTDHRAWRVGLMAAPELGMRLEGVDGLDHLPAPQLAARAGVRATWIAFWGLGLTGRLDRVTPLALDADARVPGWFELGLGVSVRL